MNSSTFTFRYIQQLQSPRQSPGSRKLNSSRFWKVAKEANRLASMVEKGWDKLSEEEREAFSDLAYSVIEPSNSIRFNFRTLIFRFQMAIDILRGQQETILEAALSVQRLVDAILNAIEQENPEYQKHIAESVEEVLSNPQAGSIVPSGGTRDWLRHLSDQALSEV